MQEALRADLTAGFAGHPLGSSSGAPPSCSCQVGLEDVVTTVLGRGHYERADGTVPGYRNGYSHHAVKTEAGVLHLRPPKVRQTSAPVSIALPDELQRMTPELGALIAGATSAASPRARWRASTRRWSGGASRRAARAAPRRSSRRSSIPGAPGT